MILRRTEAFYSLSTTWLKMQRKSKGRQGRGGEGKRGVQRGGEGREERKNKGRKGEEREGGRNKKSFLFGVLNGLEV